MSLLPDPARLEPNRAVSSRDTMVWPGAEAQYFELGRRALQLIQFSGTLCRKPHYEDILDLPCGHGRVLRWLRAAYPGARLTACDLERDGVDFCRERFQAAGVYSQVDLATLNFPAPFDLVWCGSLLTHLAPDAWAQALTSLVRWTAEDGVIVFSTQGRSFATRLARGEGSYAENVDTDALLREFQDRGFAFAPYYEDPTRSYGLTLASPEYLGRVLQRQPGVILRAYLEQAWGEQDVVILYKKSDYFAPVLAGPR